MALVPQTLAGGRGGEVTCAPPSQLPYPCREVTLCYKSVHSSNKHPLRAYHVPAALPGVKESSCLQGASREPSVQLRRQDSPRNHDGNCGSRSDQSLREFGGQAPQRARFGAAPCRGGGAGNWQTSEFSASWVYGPVKLPLLKPGDTTQESQLLILPLKPRQTKELFTTANN